MTGFGEAVERLRRATVEVRSGGSGSGIVWDREGTVITNHHVARRDEAAIELWDGRRVRAQVLSRRPARDIAVLRMAAGLMEPPERIDSRQLRPGAVVLAVGNPLGFKGALSTGVLHHVGPLSGFGRQRWVQAAVRLAPGNSGGPLADAEGRVIGINTMVAGPLALAVPSEEITVRHRGLRLGATIRPLRDGLLVLEIDPGGAASLASLHPGDVLTAAEGLSLEGAGDLAAAIEASTGLLRLEYRRGGQPNPREVVVALKPEVPIAA